MLPLRDRNPTRRRPWVTVALILVNVGVWLFVQQAGTAPVADDNRFTFEHAAIPCEITSGHPLTIGEVRSLSCDRTPPDDATEIFPDKSVYLAMVVSMFLHASWLHLGGNLLFLWVFGNNVEDRLGALRYLAFYLVGGFVATLAQVAIDPSSLSPLVGASGAVAAVMGAYLVWFPRAKIFTWVMPLLVVLAELPAWLVLSVWFALQFFTGADSNVAWMAHVGGFAFGAAVGWARRNRRGPVTAF